MGGTTNTLESAAKMVKPGGKIVVLGIFKKPMALDFGPLVRRETDIIFSFSYSTWKGVTEFEITLDMLARGILDAESLITHRFPLDKLSEGFEAALNKGESGALKVLITY